MDQPEPSQPFLGGQQHSSQSRSDDSKTPTYLTDPIGSTNRNGGQRQGGALRFGRLWKFEIFSMVTSVAALLAIIVVLFKFDGKSMNTWKAALRPNTVVSALSTLSKASMMMVVGQGLGQLKWTYFQRQPRRLMDFDIFDSASKGPLGSAELLYHINWKTLVGSAGALITLLALAMDPFVQQVVSFDSRLVDAGGMTSRIGAARIYDMNSRREASTDAAPHESYSESQKAFYPI